jgi:hypothetical protein
VKVVFRVKDTVEAADLADMVLGYDLEMPVRSLIKPTVVGHRLARLRGESASEQNAFTNMESRTEGRSVSESEGWAESSAETVGEAITSAEGEAAMSADVASRASATGSGTTSGVTNTFGVGTQTSPFGSPAIQTDVFGNPIIISVAESEGTQSSHSIMTGSASSLGRSTSSSRGRSSSKATTAGRSVSGATAYTESISQSVGTAQTWGQAHTHGVQEAFEPLYDDRPSAVHSLENVRYMGAQILCSLPTGRAAISFVHDGGMKRASLKVANVQTRALPAPAFEELRHRLLQASPSATPTAAALETIAARQRAVIAAAANARVPQPATPADYRVKKKRLVRSDPVRRLHGQPNAADRAPGQGRRKAVASGDRDP